MEPYRIYLHRFSTTDQPTFTTLSEIVEKGNNFIYLLGRTLFDLMPFEMRHYICWGAGWTKVHLNIISTKGKLFCQWISDWPTFSRTYGRWIFDIFKLTRNHLYSRTKLLVKNKFPDWLKSNFWSTSVITMELILSELKEHNVVLSGWKCTHKRKKRWSVKKSVAKENVSNQHIIHYTRWSVSPITNNRCHNFCWQ